MGNCASRKVTNTNEEEDHSTDTRNDAIPKETKKTQEKGTSTHAHDHANGKRNQDKARKSPRGFYAPEQIGLKKSQERD